MICPYSTRGVTETAAGCSSPADRSPHPLYRHHRRGLGRAHLPAARPSCNALAAGLRTQVDHRTLALGGGVACARRDRPARVGLEPVLELPRPSRLFVCGVEFVRDPAGESVPAGVARTARVVVAGAGSVADPVCRCAVWAAVGRVGVPSGARLVLRVRGWKPQACEADGASPPGGRTFFTWFAGSRQVSSPALPREAGFCPRTDSGRL